MVSRWRFRGLLWVLFAAVSVLLIGPISSHGDVPNQIDFLNHIGLIMQAKLALIEGQFPLRVMPLEADGWRYPGFQFYAPTSYLLAGFIYEWITPSNPFSAYKLMICLAMTLGGVYFYYLAYWLVRSKPAAIMAAIVYMTAPNCIYLINNLGAFNESLAVGILPAVLFYSFRRYYYPASLIYFILAAFFWYLLITIHVITFVYTSIFVALTLLVVTVRNKTYFKNVMSLAWAYGFACLLAMWYVAPVVYFGKYVLIGRTFEQMSSYLDSLHLSDLVSPIANLVKTQGVNDLMSYFHPSLGLPVLAAFVVFVYAVLAKQSLGRRWFIASPMLVFLFFCVTFLLIWSPINIWQYLPATFGMGQYTWRLLSQATWMGALLFAWAMVWLFPYKVDVKGAVFGVMLLLVCASPWFAIHYMAYIPLTSVVGHPEIREGYNGSFNLDANRHPELVTILDSMPLFFLMDKGISDYKDFSVAHNIAKPLLRSAVNPYVTVSGRLTSNMKTDTVTLIASANDHVLGVYTLKEGEFSQNISISSLKSVSPLYFRIQFKDKQEKAMLNYKISVSGFISPEKMIGVDAMKKICHQSGEDTLCQVQVPDTVKLLELPLMYYPGMWDVTLNGKPVGYFSVYYIDKLIVGVMPEAGKLNSLVARFRGLVWANAVSSCAWGIWGILVLYIVLRHFNDKKVLSKGRKHS